MLFIPEPLNLNGPIYWEQVKIPPIRLVEQNNILYAVDNRRLEAFRRAGLQIPYRMATAEEIATEAWKFSNTNGGISIQIRGNK